MKIEMTRNQKQMNQTSLNAIRSWRANCDIQVLIYESDPKNLDPAEIARVTDYVVSYACKGNASLRVEKDIIKQVIER